jgi:hypothetical protein
MTILSKLYWMVVAALVVRLLVLSGLYLCRAMAVACEMRASDQHSGDSVCRSESRVACTAIKDCAVASVGLSGRAASGYGDIRQTGSRHYHRQGCVCDTASSVFRRVGEDIFADAAGGEGVRAIGCIGIAAIGVECQCSLGSCDGVTDVRGLPVDRTHDQCFIRDGVGVICEHAMRGISADRPSNSRVCPVRLDSWRQRRRCLHPIDERPAIVMQRRLMCSDAA